VDTQAFKDIMSRIPTSVSLVSVLRDGRVEACTISSFTSVNVDSGVLLFVLRNESRTLESILLSSLFSINILSDRQKEFSILYSGNRDAGDLDLGESKWEISEISFPALINSTQSLACQLISTQIVGGSTIITAKLLSRLSSSDEKPLVYLNRKYHTPTEI
jgi:flavin reductase (DIM6/NTAB) family NADH-FMN oxidoreductase RutF